MRNILERAQYDTCLYSMNLGFGLQPELLSELLLENNWTKSSSDQWRTRHLRSSCFALESTCRAGPERSHRFGRFRMSCCYEKQRKLGENRKKRAHAASRYVRNTPVTSHGNSEEVIVSFYRFGHNNTLHTSQEGAKRRCVLLSRHGFSHQYAPDFCLPIGWEQHDGCTCQACDSVLISRG